MKFIYSPKFLLISSITLQIKFFLDFSFYPLGKYCMSVHHQSDIF